MPRVKLTASHKIKKALRKQSAGWADEVQGGVRSLEPPVQPPNVIEIGEDKTGVAAVYSLDRVDREAFLLQLVAVRNDVQGCGLGGAAVDRAMERAAQSGGADRLTEIKILGFVHERNLPSQHMLTRIGWVRLRDLENSYHEWGFNIPTPFGAPGLELDF